MIERRQVRRMTPIILAAVALLVALDAVGELAGEPMGFPYLPLGVVSVFIYFSVGAVCSWRTSLAGGFMAATAVGLLAGTVGPLAAWLIGSGPIAQEVTEPRIFAYRVAVVTATRGCGRACSGPRREAGWSGVADLPLGCAVNRKRLSLDGQWEFYPDPHQQLSPTTLQPHDARSIQVPGPWQAQFDDLRDYSGVAWYRRVFEADGRTGGRRTVTSADAPSARPPVRPSAFLHFGAVDYSTTVWLNGQQVGEHEGGYLPFELDVTADLRPGPNELVVRVIDPGNDADFLPQFTFAEIPHGKQSWYGPIGGIWQSVYLERRPPVHLTRLRITPDVPGEQAQVRVSLNRTSERPLALWLNVTDPRGQVRRHRLLLPAGTESQELAIPIPEPLLWDTTTPNLYQLQAVLLDGSDDRAEPLDTLASQFGMRTIATSPTGHLLLNGQVLYLRGALDQDYYPDLIYTPFSDEELDAQFAKAKHMGLNLLRTHIKITDPRYYDAADRAGILIWTELPNWQDLTDAAKRRAQETLFGMVERDWNHPSIIIWTIVNENWGVDLAVNAGHRAWLADMYNQLKALDPHRLVVGNSPCFTNFHVVTDIEDFHNYYAMPDHYRKWKDWVQTFASRPPWTFAHVYESIESWREYIRDPWNPVPRQPAPGGAPPRQRADGGVGVRQLGTARRGQAQGPLWPGAMVVRDRHRVGRWCGLSARHRAALQGISSRQGVSHLVGPGRRQPADAVHRAQVPDRADAAPPQHRRAT